MANDKEIIKKLLKIAEQQQKVITKLAQTMTSDHTPPPDTLEPGSPTKTEAMAILNALQPAVRSAVQTLEVHPGADSNEVKVRFVPGKGSSMVFASIQKTIQTLQSQNVLAGQSYKVTEVA